MKKIHFRVSKIFVVSLLFSFFVFDANAQTTGSVSGIVEDTVEAIIGGVVVVDGDNTLGAFTEVDGSFTINNIKPGIYTIKVNYFGYKEYKIENVEVKAGENTVLGKIVIESDVYSEQEIVVVGVRTTNSEKAAITETKESKEVINVISAEQISKSQDRDAAQVMQRIPGVTLIQNRFVMVRGLSERYNTVLLNGAVAPSAEPESRAFSFDILQSNMIDRISVFKSGSYDQPGDFAGSAIRVYTRNTVSENFVQLALTGGYRVGTTFSDFHYFDKFGSDLLGFGANKRALPADFPSLVTIEQLDYDVDKLENVSKTLPNNWAINNKTALPDGRLNLMFGKKIILGKAKLNTINSLAYSNTYQYSEIERNLYWNYTATNESETRDTYTDQFYSNDVRLSGLSNWSLILNERNKIDFRNMYSQLSNADVVERTGRNFEKDNEYLFYSLRYASNRIYSGQLQGTHGMFGDKTNVMWLLGYSDIKRGEPDWRRYSYQRKANSTGDFELVVPSGASATDAARFYLDMNENGITGNIEIEQLITGTPDTSGIKIKAGLFVDQKSRTYSARWMSYARGPQFNNAISSLDMDKLQDSIDYFNGVTLYEGTRPSDAYNANGLLTAYYLGGTIPFLKKFELSTGARIENYLQQLYSLNNTLLVDTNVIRLLPSANLSYSVSPKSKLRLSYYRTLNRPEFRELSPFSFYDFNFKLDKVGNPNLKTADIHNFDLRVEFYPSSEEMVSFGVFYKKFVNPIELYQLPASSNLLFIYGNASFAESQGVEMEIRKSLKFIANRKLFERVSLLFNGSIIQSDLELGKTISSLQISKRPMQGQSPYVVNTGLYYSDEKGWSASLLYNVFGKRIYAVGDIQIRNLYEMPRHLVDLTISKDISEKLSIKFGIADLLNSTYQIVEDGNYDEKIDNESVDKSVVKNKTGQYINIGFNYKF